jgi:Arc/MetJ-type ribon-helix-helix transcriptional regulator
MKTKRAKEDKPIGINLKVDVDLARRLKKLEYATMSEAVRYYLRLGFEYEDARKRTTIN